SKVARRNVRDKGEDGNDDVVSITLVRQTNTMHVVGLTGGIATGKSTVSRVLADHDVFVIDADAIARGVLRPGLPATRRLLRSLGPVAAAQVVDPATGEIDRQRLGTLVFADPAVRRQLNAATHPYIRYEMIRLGLWALITMQRVVVADVPLLFETDLDKWVLTTVVVYW
ncbi:hypothetical protein HK405_002310, partial [Cladochytrium tenue]